MTLVKCERVTGRSRIGPGVLDSELLLSLLCIKGGCFHITGSLCWEVWCIQVMLTVGISCLFSPTLLPGNIYFLLSLIFYVVLASFFQQVGTQSFIYVVLSVCWMVVASLPLRNLASVMSQSPSPCLWSLPQCILLPLSPEVYKMGW